MALHELALERHNLHGHFSPELEPALAVEPGESVRIATPSSGWVYESGEPVEPRDPDLDAGHALAGPIEVRGARAGQTLEVRIDEVRAGSWGVTSTEEGHELRWALDGHISIRLLTTLR